MTSNIRRTLLFYCILPISTPSVSGAPLSADDDWVQAENLQPYSLGWYQCMLVEGEWQRQGMLEEELILHNSETLIHRQTSTLDEGIVQVSDTYVDRHTFLPRHMITEVTRNGEQIASSDRRLNETGYAGTVTQGGESREVSGVISSSMLSGSSLGIPLATLDYQDEPVEFIASMMAFDGTYTVRAKWSGRETIQYHGADIELWTIDVEWQHIESGDIYPAGPDASGGRYWIARNPPKGFPYVPRYKTESYIVEFIREQCPE